MDWFLYDKNLRHERVKGPYIYDVYTEGRWRVLDIYHVFGDSIV